MGESAVLATAKEYAAEFSAALRAWPAIRKAAATILTDN